MCRHLLWKLAMKDLIKRVSFVCHLFKSVPSLSMNIIVVSIIGLRLETSEIGSGY